MLTDMLYNPFKKLEKHEWILWLISLVAVLLPGILSKNSDFLTLLSTATGVTALIFVARGDSWGQLLTMAFGVLYAFVSYRTKYYGEMITYVGMSLPAAGFALYSWLKNPYRQGEVKIHKLKKAEIIGIISASLVVTFIFFFLLKALGTARLSVSTVSVFTSFLACALLFFRSPYYVLAYGANDIVLIVLWVLASLKDLSYLPMVMCFAAFLANDSYGFFSWKIREKKQKSSNNRPRLN